MARHHSNAGQGNSGWTEGGASLDPSGLYRYRLWRTWDPALPVVAFVGLNPSTADATQDDPTLRRLMGFARTWGYGGLVLVNLYAYRATKPKDLWRAADPVGPDTDAALRKAAEASDQVVVCWGRHGSKGDRAVEVLQVLAASGRTVHCLGYNADGSPKHPLYLRREASRVPYRPCV